MTARGKSLPGIRPSRHPGGRRGGSVTDFRFAPSERLVRRVQEPSRCSRDFHHGLLKRLGPAGVLAALLVGVPFMRAYELLDSHWPQPSTTMHVDVPGADGLWNSAFDEAMSLWNERTIFEFRRVREYADPCSDPNENTDRRNGVAFSDTVCGDEWGDKTLAVARTWSSSGVTSQSGILFDRNRRWNVYSGPWRYDDLNDFRRVAVHELGHVMGLAHEDDVPAIMQTFASDIEEPQADDIRGVAAIYGGTGTPGDTRPENDDFSRALTISGSSGRTAGNSVGATVEAREPGEGTRSVWWQWRAPAGGEATIDTVGSDFDTTLGVYTGTRVDALTRLAENDDDVGLQSRVTLTVTAGTVYRLRVAGYDDAAGEIVLNWSSRTGGPPSPPEDGETFLIFPQVASGKLSDGAFYRTTISLIRGSEGDATCDLNLYGMEVDFGGVRGSSFFGTVPGQGFLSVRTRGDGEIQVGYATVACDAAVSGQLTYASHDAAGTKIAEATVFPTEVESAGYDIIVDGRSGARLALAIANHSDLTRSYDLRLRNSSGATVSSGSVEVPARSNLARFVNEMISPGAASGQVYLLEVRSSDGSGFSMIGLRFTGSVFSVVPAVPKAESP